MSGFSSERDQKCAQTTRRVLCAAVQTIGFRLFRTVVSGDLLRGHAAFHPPRCRSPSEETGS